MTAPTPVSPEAPPAPATAAPRPPARAAVVFAVALVVSLTAWTAVVVPRLPGPPQAAYGWNAAAAAVVLLLAKRWGLSWAELGLSRAGVRSGVRWGLRAALVVAAGYGLLLAVPASRALLTSASPDGMVPQDVLLGALLQIPVGTVLWEELAFRGALLAALLRVMRPSRAIAVAGVLFGLWHLRPALEGAAAGGAAAAVPAWAVILAVVTATAAAGWLFGWLRLRTKSLVAPAGLHMATNSLGLLSTWAAAAVL